MINKVNFDTSNKPFSEIVGNGKEYKVPKYQRDYSWGSEQWEDLWQDICDIHNQQDEEREEHYMGYLVLQKQSINTFKVIDGQQRLTTLSLLILAALQLLKKSSDGGDHRRMNLLKERYISTTSASSFEEHYKLELNRNNDKYYRFDLVSLSETPRKRNIKASEHKMRRAKEFYEKQIKNLGFTGQELGEFIENIISHYLLFTVITVGDDVNAYKVFETLNARGVQLSTPDLLKNHLFSIIDPKAENSSLIERQEESWGDTLGNLGKEDFSKFLRCFWNSRHSITSKTALFKKIKTSCKEVATAIELLDNLQKSSSIYAALNNPDDEYWKAISNAANKENIDACLLALKTFNLSQPYPILLSAHFVYDTDDFAKLCRWLLAFFIRYQVTCQLPASDVENFYNTVAQSIHSRVAIDKIKEALRARLPDNEAFKQAFASKTFATTQSTKKVYYLLASLENHINPNNYTPLKGTLTIEHVLPKKESTNELYWRDHFGDLLEQNIQRLGNLTLLPAKVNKDVAQGGFGAKKMAYRRSALAIVRKITEYEDWSPDAVNEYQAWLAQHAVGTWRID